jgi:DNA polymerase I-like protein with 3'-5' exonuclease and polymerase domains
MPRRWSSAYADVRTLTDAQREKWGLSTRKSICEVVGSEYVGPRKPKYTVRDVIDYAREKKCVAFDTETTGLNFFKDRIILVQIGDEERQYLVWWETLSKAEQEEILREVWMDEEIRKVGVNLKFDAKMILGNHGLEWRGARLIDTQLLDQILNCGLLGDIGATFALTSMGSMAKRYLGLILVKDEDIRTGWGEVTPLEWWAEGASEEERAAGETKRHYAADDVPVPLAILKWQMPWIKKFDLVDAVKLEMQFLPELAEMEMKGLYLDADMWKDLCREAEAGLKEAERELDGLFDVTVTYRVDLDGNVQIERDKNYNSTDQLKDLIREWMAKHRGVEVVCNNGHFRESLLRAGMRPERMEKLLEQKLVPDPEDREGKKRKKVGYPSASDYLTGAEIGDEKVPELWSLYRRRLTEGAFRLPDTDSKTLKLMKILHDTPDHQIDPNMETTRGLPPELVNPILKLREFSTKMERYAWNWIGDGDKVAGIVNPVSGRIHTDTTQCAADTARLTTRPNFQNLPADQRYRSCIRAAPGYKIVGADFSQIEPRIIAEISEDPTYMRVFWSGSPGTAGHRYWCGDYEGEELDLYASVGAMVGVLPSDYVTKSACNATEAGKKGRKYSKIIVLGLGYGTGPEKFQTMLCLDTGEYHTLDYATELFKSFWNGASMVKATLDRLSALADPRKSQRKVWHPFKEAKVTYSESLMGRKRFFDADSPQWWTQGRNHPIQSTGADILKLSVVYLQNAFRTEALDARVVLTAHDEVLAEAKEEHAARVAVLMETLMKKAGQKWCKHVPISAEATITDYWLKD